MKSYDLNLLLALDALLSTRSVTAAAERMHLSTPAMSHTLARIREVFGDPILVRAGRQLVPTPRALALAQPVAQWIQGAQSLVHPGQDQALEATQRHFVVRSPDGVAVIFGAALSKAMEEAMPAATLQFVSETAIDATALREGRVDIDIGSFRDTDPEVHTEVLSQQRFVGAVRADHALLQGRRTAKRYAAQRHVAVNLRPRERSGVDDALAELGLARHKALTVPNSYAALIAASRSHLVATVTERVARAMHADLGLVLFELPLSVEPEPLLLAWHPRNHAHPAHVWLRQCVLKLMSGKAWDRSHLQTTSPLIEHAASHAVQRLRPPA